MKFDDYDLITNKKIKKRKEFKTSTKREALKNSKYRCQKCRDKLRKSIHKKFGYVVNFDHWDNNPLHNSLKNCKVLCPTCHASLTVLKKRKERDMLGMYKHKTIKKYSGVKRKKKKRSDIGKKRKKKPSSLLLDIKIPQSRFPNFRNLK